MKFGILVTSLLFASNSGSASDLSQAVNFQAVANLPGPAQAKLDATGLVARPTSYDQLSELYASIRKSGQPMFITTDCVFHSFHLLFDYALRDAETRFFYDQAQELTKALLGYEQDALKLAQDPDLREALTRNIAYLAVAASVLDSSFTPPLAVEPLVRQELALIDAHAAEVVSPVMGVKEDYSQYLPRGHYTRSDRLKRYFRAMMWYGRMPFLLKPGKDARSIELGRALTRRALLLCDALQNAQVGTDPALNLCRPLYDPTLCLVVRSDDLTLPHSLKLAQHLVGD
ncbi:MAG: DUF3160 domain-containing protein, partial [candidate division WOR-3 bacterium]